ncbi:MAG: chemotaxis protein CheA [Candidatus Kapabacteria bacterium]|jgi:two-component system chemotaxis sensor kinase CheA|nr:chemotaxis protein CheA [Candidatus Kapabacteria bacterium]
MDRETLEIVRAFVIESLDSLDEQEGKIQDILDTGSKESINAIFRVFHTIKGLSGFLNFNTLNTVTHEAETLLDLLRNKPEAVSEPVIDLIYQSFDVLRTLLNTVASVMKDTGNEEIVRALISKLQEGITSIKSGVALQGKQAIAPPQPSIHAPSPSAINSTIAPPQIPPVFPAGAEPADDFFANLDVDNMSEEELEASMAQVFDAQATVQTSEVSQNSEQTFPDDFFFSDSQLATLENMPNRASQEPFSLSSSLTASEQNTAFSPAVIAPDILQRYLTEALELVSVAEDGCLRLEQNPNDMTVVGTIFGAVHSLKGNSGFMGFADIEGMSTDLENILDAVRAKTLEVYPGLISMLLTNIDIIKSAVAELAAQQNFALQPIPKQRTKTAPVPVSSPQQTKQPLAPPVIESALNDEFLQQIWEAPHQEDVQSITPSTTNESASIAEKSALDEQTHGNGEQTQPTELVGAAAKAEAVAGMLQRRDIRVDMEKLDKLFDLVGELITIESMVTSNPEVQALELESFNKAAAMLNKITRELQEVTMSIRMMPLDGLFNKMKRLVRDLSMRFDKKINLEISGAETEMDKNVIEEVSDPLMHIIRNAIDHGVESRERRLKAGKSETGTVKLQARYEGNEILIIIEDDGGGINREKILEKAASKGILKVAPDKMTDREVNMLIFEPGFSTAEKITDISGRGVGMDVVKRNIEKLQGSITVDTRDGKGTRFTLRIPLTLAIMDAMMIRVGQSIYALPILAIKESFRPQEQAITITMDGQEVVRVRDELFSVVRLHELYDRTPDTTLLHEGILVIVEARERKACLFVDEIIGQQQIVVKNLSDYVGNVEGITGCMIQSNGEVGLIIDVDMLLQMMSGSLAFNLLHD